MATSQPRPSRNRPEPKAFPLPTTMHVTDSTRFRKGLPRPSHLLLRSRPLLGVAIVGAIGLGLLAALAPSWLLEVDEPLSESARSAGGSDVWTAITHVAGPSTGIVISLVVAALMWRRCRGISMTFPAIVGLAIVSDVVLKVLVDRPRPDAPLVGTSLGSFPSGHTIMGVVVLGMLPPILWILTHRRWAFWASAGLLFVGVPSIAASRVILGAHWPSDVVASLFIGAALLLLGEYFVGSGWVSEHCGSCAIHVEAPHPEIVGAAQR